MRRYRLDVEDRAPGDRTVRLWLRPLVITWSRYDSAWTLAVGWRPRAEL